MIKNDLAALLDAVCESPLREEQRALTAAERLALKRAVTQAAAEGGASAEPTEMRDRLTAALASVLSGSCDEAARRALAESMLRSAEVRLDAQSASAFVDAVEQSIEAAPAHLLEQIIASDTAPVARPAALFEQTGQRDRWSLLAGRAWSVRRWGAAAACAVLLAAGGLSWSIYRQSSSIAPAAAPPPPIAETAAKPPSIADAPAPPAAKPSSVADAPAPPKPALETARRPCAPAIMKNEQSGAQPLRVGPAVDAEKRAGDDGCDADDNEAVAARARLEAARQAAAERAAAERAAAEAAARVGAAQSGGVDRGPVAAGRMRPPVGAPARDVPAAAATAPSSPSLYGVAPLATPPAAAPAAPPSGAAR